MLTTFGFGTDFRLPNENTNVVKIQFQSVLNTLVSFSLDLHSGQVSAVQNWTPQSLIPNWHTTEPFFNWSIQAQHYILEFHSNQLISSTTSVYPEFLRSLTNTVVRDIWIGKYGYRL